MTPYDQVPYVTSPSRSNHPDRLATVGTLFGMAPAPVTECRVLEIGCGDGSNLIPMASYLPGSRFVGVDLASGAISKGSEAIRELGLRNVRLFAGDLRDIGNEYGEFDYIIAHGLFSWVPNDVREALLRVCAERLASQGIAYVSYNAYPGRHVRQMLTEMLVHLTASIEDAATKIQNARVLLQSLKESRLSPVAWREMLRQEADQLLDKRDHALWHDDLSSVYRPFYFHEFAAMASKHDLQYLGESEIHTMSDLRPVDGGPTELIQREQYLDFLMCRRFRETLLCRAEVRLDRAVGPERMKRFLFSAPCKRLKDGSLQGMHDVAIPPGQPSLEQVVERFGDLYPLPAPGEDADPRILFALVSSGFATIHVHGFECARDVGARPMAFNLVRYLAARGNVVTSSAHMAVRLDDAERRILCRLDGSYDLEALAGALRVRPEPLSQALQWMARMGLLAG